MLALGTPHPRPAPRGSPRTRDLPGRRKSPRGCMDPCPAACTVFRVPETSPLRMHNPLPDPQPSSPADGRSSPGVWERLTRPRAPPPPPPSLQKASRCCGAGALHAGLARPAHPCPLPRPPGVRAARGAVWGRVGVGPSSTSAELWRDSSHPGRRLPTGDPQAEC